MLRKLTLTAVVALALSVAGSIVSAYAGDLLLPISSAQSPTSDSGSQGSIPTNEPDCKDYQHGNKALKYNGKPFPVGIYPPSSPWTKTKPKKPNIGKFDLDFGAAANTAVNVDGGGVMCGTRTKGGASMGVYFKNATITYPKTTGLTVTCARPPTKGTSQYPAVCGTRNIPEGAYVGYTIGDAWCSADACGLFDHQIEGGETLTTVKYDTSGPGLQSELHDAAANHCVDTPDRTVIACMESSVDLVIGSCASDVIISQNTDGDDKMTIYQPSCGGSDYSIGPSYIDGVRKLTICDYVNLSGDSSCGGSAPSTQCSIGGTKPESCAMTMSGKGKYQFEISTNRVTQKFLNSDHSKWIDCPSDDPAEAKLCKSQKVPSPKPLEVRALAPPGEWK